MCRTLFLRKESRPLIIKNLLLLVNLFSQLIQNLIPACVHLATEKSKTGSIVIGLKTKIGNPGYTAMQKKMQLFVLLLLQLKWISPQVKMQTKHSSQMASRIGKMLGQTLPIWDLQKSSRKTVCNARCLWWYFSSVIYHVQWSKVSRSTESAEISFECYVFIDTSSSNEDFKFFQL